MGRIIHASTRPNWLRPALVGAVLVGLAGLAWLGLGDDKAPANAPDAAAVGAAGAGASVAAGTLGTESAFPNVRLALVEVALNTSPPGAVLDVEARRGRFSAGQEVFPGIRLDRVFSDRVVLAHGSTTRTLRIAASPTGPGAQARADGAEAEDPNDIRVRNKAINTRLLTQSRPMAADAFLREVHITPSPRGGFVVEEVMPGSVYDQLGLRRGDVVYSLDVPGAKPVDEGSMISLMQQTLLEMDVYRNGAALRLRHDLTADPEAAAASSPTR